MRRREFIAGLGGAVAWPMVARAQQSSVPVIGHLAPFESSRANRLLNDFRKGLSETGYVEGQNVSIEYRGTGGRNDPLTALPFAKELVDRRVSVIVATTVPLAIAVKNLTQAIPIVVRAGTDPVTAGLVTSLNRPGAKVTGISTFNRDLGPKRLELLRELLPTGATVAVLISRTNVVSAAEAKEVEAAARILGLRLVALNASSMSEVEAGFMSIAQRDIKGVFIINDPLFIREADRLAAVVARTGLPAIFNDRAFVEAGGLMSYGTDVANGFRLVGVYTGRILRGEKPGDLPVQQAVKLEFVINGKTAKALGVTIPETLLATADQVIE
jgi:putative tryptophan/tyrosine transport system substrate-binding protein